jgi:glycosyltransferase involved in cell wall biosynthesis
MEDKKIKVLVISDHYLSPSGVGTQTKYVVDGLLKTGKYQIMYLGGAIKHTDYRPMRFQEYGDDLTVVPVDGYGNDQMIRDHVNIFKPDVLWFMTDPRFWTWLWHFCHEIRENVPMVYYHVWDNYPYPKFNRKYYLSNDKIVSISKVTSDIVRNVAPEVDETYLPHAVETSIFKKLPKKDYEHILPKQGKTLFFWNSRNARRKQSGSVVWWYKKFLDVVGHDKAFLLMHTEPKDPNGQDLIAIAEELGLTKENFGISTVKMPPQELAKLYNAADFTINISDAEGFGLSVLESLACETPVIGNLTGGITEQLIDDEGNPLGIAIKPLSRAVIGSQEVPWIYEDRISEQDFVDALVLAHHMSREEKERLGSLARKHVEKNFNFENFTKKWHEIMLDVHEKNGSWETRKNYKGWTLKGY